MSEPRSPCAISLERLSKDVAHAESGLLLVAQILRQTQIREIELIAENVRLRQALVSASMRLADMRAEHVTEEDVRLFAEIEAALRKEITNENQEVS